MMANLKLPKLPDRTPVKLTITISPELKAVLEAYASAYEAAYGEREPIVELIPAMLVGFLASDRSFSRGSKERR